MIKFQSDENHSLEGLFKKIPSGFFHHIESPKAVSNIVYISSRHLKVYPIISSWEPLQNVPFSKFLWMCSCTVIVEIFGKLSDFHGFIYGRIRATTVNFNQKYTHSLPYSIFPFMETSLTLILLKHVFWTFESIAKFEVISQSVNSSHRCGVLFRQWAQPLITNCTCVPRRRLYVL
jgi:hypothetical protein